MSIEEFESHLRDPSPCFRCYPCGEDAGSIEYLARVGHRLNPPASDCALSTIDQLLGPSGATPKEFYARHDGLVMYEDSQPSRWSGGEYRAAGLEFFAVADWEDKSREMRESLLESGCAHADLTDWLKHGIVFGELPHSANYLVIQPAGDDAGKIFYAVHDGFEGDPIAESFDDFLEAILADPADFLNRMGCYTRYSDGNTENQWIPQEYIPDSSTAI